MTAENNDFFDGIGPETRQQTANRETKEYNQRLEARTNVEFNAAIAGAAQTVDLVLEDLARENVTVSQMKHDELLQKAIAKVEDQYLPKEKYPGVETDWSEPKVVTYLDVDELTSHKETSEVSASLKSIQDTIETSAPTSKIEHYAQGIEKQTDVLLHKWKDTLSDVPTLRYINPKATEGKSDADIRNLSNADKLRLIKTAKNRSGGTTPSWVGVDKNNNAWVDIGAYSQGHILDDNSKLDYKDYSTFQDNALKALHVMHPDEDEVTLHTKVKAANYDGSRGVYNAQSKSLETEIDGGFKVKVDFNSNYFRIYASESTLLSLIEDLPEK